jgi:hypothetical protein
MKIYIGNYKNFFGPYQLADLLCFWTKKKNEYGYYETPEWVDRFGEFLAYGSIKKEPEAGEIYSINDHNIREKTWIYKFLLYLDKKKKRKIKIKIHDYDIWDAYTTMGMIILSMLKKIKEQKYGFPPHIDDEDVPENIRSINAPPKQNEYDIDDFYHQRWHYVLNEMIFAFESISGDLINWEDQFYHKIDRKNTKLKKLDDGSSTLLNDRDSLIIDREGLKEYEKRIDNGLRLFSKYYRSLWI